ncbi:hypothetical protein DFP72DRAFT_510555 [Ephemerocybe angulata]|uniref:Uncharacterized protein n=1 Tax=Ephemerocybe angulata TaxID=980116 RepID=A0A8H6M272_9AGAR|nr:hypothetical protein DFP72DRAFT_510555 [Tulosesus angulatus]
MNPTSTRVAMSSDTSSPQDIPQEIFDYITDYVAQTCPASLSNLSLSSRQHFLHRARPYIFHAIQISNPRKIAQLLEIGENDPLLFAHTRSLHLSIRLYCDSDIYCRTLHRFATRLRSLRGLHVEGFHSGLQGRRAIYTELNPFFLEAVKTILLTQPITQLSLHHLYDFPVDLIIPLQNLHRLEITGWSGAPYNRLLFPMAGAPRPAADIPWRIQTLKCDEGGMELLPFILTGPCAIYNGLVRLDITIMRLNQQAAWSFLHALSGSTALEYLSLGYAQDRGHGQVLTLLHQLSRSSTALPFLPSLRSLHLTLEAEELRLAYIAAENLHIFMAGFPSTILAQHSRPCLEVLEITHIVTSRIGEMTEYWNNVGWIPLIPVTQIWSRLDDVLTDDTLLPRLQALRMTARYDGKYRRDESITSADEQIQRQMSESRGGELLSLLPRATKRISVLDIGLSAEAEARFEELSSQYPHAPPLN